MKEYIILNVNKDATIKNVKCVELKRRLEYTNLKDDLIINKYLML